MKGLDLLEMLQSLQRDLKAVVVDNQYDPEREQRALELSAIQYVCKPLQLAWFKAWQRSSTDVQISNPHFSATQKIEHLSEQVPQP